MWSEMFNVYVYVKTFTLVVSLAASYTSLGYYA